MWELLPPWMKLLGPPLGVAAGGLFWGMFNPRSRLMGPLWFRGEPSADGRPRVALTFDDGPTPDSTPAVLDALGKVDAPAAFFVIGRNVLTHPRLVERMDREGHLVANHSFDHDRQGLWGLNRFWRRQLDATDDAVFDVIGRRPALFRPPMGLKHWHLMQEAMRTGHATVTWNRRALDGRRWPAATPQRIVKRLARSRDGDVLLLHDGHEPTRPRNRQATADAVVPLVNQLRDKGVKVVRLDDLLGIAGYQ